MLKADANKPALLRLRVTSAAERTLRQGHPWVYDKSILEQKGSGQTGELAVIYDRENQFLALGLFDAASPIRFRSLNVGAPTTLDRAWWGGRLAAACHARVEAFDSQTTGYRCVHGENDGWPGLVLDRYDRTFVLKLYTAAWFSRLEEIAGLIEQQLSPERIVLRLSRNLQVEARALGLADGQVIKGAPLDGPVTFLESGLRFESDALRGQKTGFFLDQRENRRLVGESAGGRAVLNVFSFSGGFSLYAARGGARSATDLDISRHALAAAQRNFDLNQSHPQVAACRHESVQADAFEWLAADPKPRYDFIVLDPPSLAKRESERHGALTAYHRLVSLAGKHLAPGGILVACSCSAHVSTSEFYETVRAAATPLQLRELRTTGHPSDHPAKFKEAEYLKAIFLQFV